MQLGRPRKIQPLTDDDPNSRCKGCGARFAANAGKNMSTYLTLHLTARPTCCRVYDRDDDVVLIDGELIIPQTLRVIHLGIYGGRGFVAQGVSVESVKLTFRKHAFCYEAQAREWLGKLRNGQPPH